MAVKMSSLSDLQQTKDDYVILGYYDRLLDSHHNGFLDRNLFIIKGIQIFISDGYFRIRNGFMNFNDYRGFPVRKLTKLEKLIYSDMYKFAESNK